MNDFALKVPTFLRQLPPSFAIRFLLECVGRGNVVYLITCLVSGEQYIGESSNFSTRMQKHEGDLKGSRHHSRLMQRAFNSYGSEAFVVEILENCDGLSAESRKAKQDFYIWAIKPNFNS
jgi:group I intron endonuclease